MTKYLCEGVIFGVYASLGTFGALSQKTRIFSQEVRGIQNRDQSAISQDDGVKLERSAGGKSGR